MRTSLNFVFVLDIVSQALAWVYLENRLDKLRPMGLRGAFELAVLSDEVKNEVMPLHANAVALLRQLPTALDMTVEQVANAIHQIADDEYVRFLLIAYS